MRAHFINTSWTMVLDAAKTDAQESRPALERLCKAYWEPLYVFACRTGSSHADAQDITQAFFEHLLASNLPGRAAPGLGRFRSFLLVSMRNFIITAHQKKTALKRGGDAEHVRLDEEHDSTPEAGASGSPEEAYDRKFAHTLVNLVLDQLAEQQAELSKADRFLHLRPMLLSTERVEADHAALSTRFGMSDQSIRTTLSRLRAQFRELVRREVTRIVDDPADVDGEIAYLLRALRG